MANSRLTKDEAKKVTKNLVRIHSNIESAIAAFEDEADEMCEADLFEVLQETVAALDKLRQVRLVGEVI